MRRGIVVAGLVAAIAAIASAIAYATNPNENSRPGPPAAFALVFPDGTIGIRDGAPAARNMSSGNITHPSAGVYCFVDLKFQPWSVVATGLAEKTLASANFAVPPSESLLECPPDATARVRTVDSTTGIREDRAFLVWLED